LTVIEPERPSTSTLMVRARSAISQSLLASGGYTGGTPAPEAWWHIAQVRA
jgi:hypothetical protein